MWVMAFVTKEWDQRKCQNNLLVIAMYPDFTWPKVVAHYTHVKNTGNVASLMKVSKSTIHGWIATDGVVATPKKTRTRRSKTQHASDHTLFCERERG